MIVVCNSSPLIALSRIQRLEIFKQLFGIIYIPDTVYQEVVLESHDPIQQDTIRAAIGNFIIVEKPKTDYIYTRAIDRGEQGVLNLAYEKEADLLIIDDKKARNEAREHGFKVIKTSTILKRAEASRLIRSYREIVAELERKKIYLP